MANRIAGTCYVKADGDIVEPKGDIEVPLTDTKRAPAEGLNSTVGIIETHRTPYIKLKGLFGPNFPIDRLKKSTDMTITAEMINGRVYTLSGAWLAGEPTYDPTSGEVDLEFNGTRGIWQ